MKPTLATLSRQHSVSCHFHVSRGFPVANLHRCNWNPSTNVVGLEAHMIPHARWSGTLIAIGLLIASGGMSWREPTRTQSPAQRDDPATSGAGPTSSAPGQYNYDPPKSGSVTIDARGVTTVQPSPGTPKTDAPANRGNE